LTGGVRAAEKQFESYRTAFRREGQRLIVFMSTYRRIHERRHDRLEALNVAPAFFQTVLASLHVSIVVGAHALFSGVGRNEESLRTFLRFVSRNIDIFSLKELSRRKRWPMNHPNMRHRRAPSIVTVRQDRKTLDRLQGLKSFEKQRNKIYAHLDAEYLLNPGRLADEAPIQWKDLTELRDIFASTVNRYSSAYDANTFEFEPVNVHDVDDVIEVLWRQQERDP
jgi:AbiU2